MPLSPALRRQADLSVQGQPGLQEVVPGKASKKPCLEKNKRKKKVNYTPHLEILAMLLLKQFAIIHDLMFPSSLKGIFKGNYASLNIRDPFYSNTDPFKS